VRRDNLGMSLLALYDVPAPAKINLFLHVVGRRDDGYHLLQSVFVLIDWADRLHFERRADGQLGRRDLGPAMPADDLCLRAARLLKQASGTAWGADIVLDKRVPWGAGLGGGSSDAASTLLALNRLWGLHWSRQRLGALGLMLGADVPFFIGGRNAFVEGIGERLHPLPEGTLPRQWLAVVKPAPAIATADIFGSPRLVRDTKPVIVMDFLAEARHRLAPASGEAGFGQANGQGNGLDFGRNDLQAPAEAACPEVTQVVAWLHKRFGNSRMSGSGSAVFARAGAGSQPLATWDAEELPPTWVGRMCRSLDSHPLVHWAV
jgi:4-diphosphocytidyl-2-C-methyl-D-erythritol kinase